MDKEQFYQQLLLLVPDAAAAKFLLAVSGGRDSIALAHLFTACNLHFDIAHCNFHLRGEESDNEAAFVQQLPFLTTQKVFVKDFDTMAIQRQSGKSVEMVARQLRYQWFEEVGKDYDCIVTAHHANDNAETVLMNMLRGTGLRGMCGIPPKNGKIIRPLLRFWRQEIEKYCLEQDLQYCDDSSNFSDQFLRNRVRHYVIPELEKINPQIVDVFSRNSELFLQQTQFFNAHIQQYKNLLVKEEKERIIIDILSLRNIDYQSLILYEILNPFGFNAIETDNILKSMNATSGKQFLSDTHILIKDRNRFIIEKKDTKKEDVIIINCIEELEQYGFAVEKMPVTSNFQTVKDNHIIYVDADKLRFPLTIRNWREGDFFYPFGMKTKKKLSDFFTDLKIDLLEKQKIRLLCAQDQIVWVINLRADERFRVGADTREWYYRIVNNE